jgi:hypothetical protein
MKYLVAILVVIGIMSIPHLLVMLVWALSFFSFDYVSVVTDVVFLGIWTLILMPVLAITSIDVFLSLIKKEEL